MFVIAVYFAVLRSGRRAITWAGFGPARCGPTCLRPVRRHICAALLACGTLLHPTAVLLAAPADAIIPAADPLSAAEPPAAEPLPPALAARYQQALQLLQSGAFHQAQSLLEDIVAAHPRFAGAWLDLALAAWQAGDTVAALEHLAYVRQHFPLPPALYRQILAWQQHWQSSAPAAPVADDRSARPQDWQAELSLEQGHNSNVNGGLLHDQIALSLPEGGVVSLPIDAAYYPRGDRYTQLGLLAAKKMAYDFGLLHPLLYVRERRMQTESAYDQSDVQAGLIYQTLPNESGRRWQLSLFWRQDRQGGRALLETRRLSLQRQYQGQHCRTFWGGEIEARNYFNHPLDGRLYWLSLGGSCILPTATQLTLNLRGGRDRPRGRDRPGGEMHQYDIGLQAIQPLGGGRSLEVRWQSQRSQDQAGYSPLLAQNAPRRLRRNQYELLFQVPLETRWALKLTWLT